MPDVNGKSAGFIGYRGRLSRSTDSKATWAAIPEVKSITPAEPSIGEAEFTHLESPDKTREFKATFKDLGTLQVVANYVDGVLDAAGAAIQLALINDFGVNDSDYYWKIEYRREDDTVIKTVTFPGYVSSAKAPDLTVQDPTDFKFSVRVTGAAVWS
jgi:hypothetical protein